MTDLTPSSPRRRTSAAPGAGAGARCAQAARGCSPAGAEGAGPAVRGQGAAGGEAWRANSFCQRGAVPTQFSCKTILARCVICAILFLWHSEQRETVPQYYVHNTGLAILLLLFLPCCNP